MSFRLRGNRTRLSLRSVLTVLLFAFVTILALAFISSSYVHDANSRQHLMMARWQPGDKKLLYQLEKNEVVMPQVLGRSVELEGGKVLHQREAKRGPDMVIQDIQSGRVIKFSEQRSGEVEEDRQNSEGDQFQSHEENAIKQVNLEPISTFSVDVDTASYSYARRLLKQGRLPSPGSIKVEEFINYFDYSYPQPQNRSVPFEPSVLVTDSPWNKGRKLMHIGIKGYDVDPASRPFCNIVFLVDVSGSMDARDKLHLAKTAIEELVTSSLGPSDMVSIVTYASSVRVALAPTPAGRNWRILSAIRSLEAGGSTYGAGGIEKAYTLAEENFDKDAVNRIILVSDGDFNVGVSDSDGLQKLIEDKRDSGIFLSALGFGMGNYKDTTMKALANHGNGVAAYIDTIEEAKKVMNTEASSTVFPIAKDVKIQVEFNPTMISEYRLVGYEKRLLRNEDFNNDKVDAGDIGSGHTVTAIYEFTPADSKEGLALDPLRYAQPKETASNGSQEYAYLKIRYKLPKESTSQLISRAITKEDHEEALLQQQPMMDFRAPLTIQEFKFAAQVAGFAQLLKGGHYMDHYSFSAIQRMPPAHDPHGYRAEFLKLVGMAEKIR